MFRFSKSPVKAMFSRIDPWQVFLQGSKPSLFNATINSE
jgi:hypothetical protein